MSHAPWSKADAEKAADTLGLRDDDRTRHWERECFLAGVKWAAEMIEASATIYANDNNSNSSFWYRQGHASDTHQAKLVNVKPIEKGKSDE